MNNNIQITKKYFKSSGKPLNLNYSVTIGNNEDYKLSNIKKFQIKNKNNDVWVITQYDNLKENKDHVGWDYLRLSNIVPGFTYRIKIPLNKNLIHKYLQNNRRYNNLKLWYKIRRYFLWI